MANSYSNINGVEAKTVLSPKEDSSEDSSEGDFLTGRQRSLRDEDEEDDSEENSCCANLIETHCWNYGVVTLILINTIALAVECETPHWPGWLWFEFVFVNLFAIELLVRLYVYRCAFFTDPGEMWWNLGDSVVISLGVADLWWRFFHVYFGIDDPVQDSPAEDIGYLITVIRIVRCLRVLRSIRLLRELKQLNLLAVGFVYAVGAAMWMTLLIIVIISIFAIFTTTLLGHHASDWTKGSEGSQEDEEYISDHFGGWWRSWVTMFQIITLDEWSSMIRVVNKRMPWLTPVFMIYVMIMAFTMLSLLTGVMAQKITKTALETNEAEKERAFDKFMRVVELHFKANDTGSGISVEQLVEIFAAPDLKASLQKLNKKGILLSVDDVRDMCQAMDLGRYSLITWQGFEVNLSQFLEAGSAKNLFLLRSDVQRLEKMLSRSSPQAIPMASTQEPANPMRVSSSHVRVVG